MLRQELLDLGDARAGPVLHPGLREVVLDVMEAALAHANHDRRGFARTPWAERLICRGAGTHPAPRREAV